MNDDIWSGAAGAVEQALRQTRQRLVELRAERERLRVQIRELVANEEDLTRMWRIAERRQSEPTTAADG